MADITGIVLVEFSVQNRLVLPKTSFSPYLMGALRDVTFSFFIIIVSVSLCLTHANLHTKNRSYAIM